jgi:hypothetical protein
MRRSPVLALADLEARVNRADEREEGGKRRVDRVRIGMVAVIGDGRRVALAA